MPSSADPFELLGLPASYAVSAASVRAAWRRLAAEAHPDHAAQETAVEESDRLRRAAAINRAKYVLEDDLLRAEALLERLCQGAEPGGVAEALPEGFLMEAMELREALEEAQDQGDTEAIAALAASAADDRDSRISRIGMLFQRAESAANDDEQAVAIGAIRQELNALRYVQRLHTAAHGDA